MQIFGVVYQDSILIHTVRHRALCRFLDVLMSQPTHDETAAAVTASPMTINDADSAVGINDDDDYDGDDTSLASSIMAYNIRHGHTYHNHRTARR